MANQRAAKPLTSKAVFVNCPFDEDFKPIFRAMIFAVSSGYNPRCALDSTDGAEIRVSKIATMIGECDYGIHDLSRVEVDAGGVPRFNMPMELGLHLGARLFGSGRQKRKRALILETRPHRHDAVLSDISGQDIEVHGNDPGQAIRCVRNWLSAHRAPIEPPLLGAVAMLGDYRRPTGGTPTQLTMVRPEGLFALRAHPFGAALRAFNFACGEVVEPGLFVCRGFESATSNSADRPGVLQPS